MANWYSTSFKTNDFDIVELIRQGKTMDFDYDEESGYGNCRLRYGFNALDLETIENVAKNLYPRLKKDDVVIGLGAGTITTLGKELLKLDSEK